MGFREGRKTAIYDYFARFPAILLGLAEHC